MSPHARRPFRPSNCTRSLPALMLGLALLFALNARAQTVLTWSSGDILNATTGLGATFATPTLTSGFTVNVTTASSHTFDGRAVVNNATLNWSGGSFVAGNGGTLTNNATLNDTSTGVFGNSGAGGTTMTFTNAAGAVYHKQSTGTKDTNVVVTNAGTINVDVGTLRFSAGGSSAGTIDADSGTTVQFTNNFSLPDASKLIGTGLYELTNGTLSVAGNFTVPVFNQSGGSLAGTFTLASGNTFNWTGGNWNSSGTTATIASGAILNLSTANSHNFDARAIVNNGTLNWSGGNFVAGNGGTLTNNATLNDSSTGVFANSGAGGTTMTFTNAAGATYNKQSTGIKDTNVVVTNAGILNVDTGTLRFNGGGSSAGTIDAEAGTTVQFTNSFSLPDVSKLVGTGLYELTNGTLSVAGNFTVPVFNQSGGTLAGTFSLASGHTFNWTGGNWNSSGTTATIASGAILNLSTTNSHNFDARAIVNHGTLNWSGGNFVAGNGGTLTNNATLNDSSTGVFANSGAGGTTMTFTNAAGATYNKQSTGIKDTNVVVTNAGTINVDVGTLRFNGGGSSAGSIDADAGTTVQFTNSFSVPDLSKLTGAGLYELTNGTLSAGGTLTVPIFNQTGGTLAGTVSLGSGNVYNWSGGNWNASGTTTIASGATLNLTTTNSHNFDSRAIINNGTLNWTAGNFVAGNGGTLTNHAALNDTSTGVFANSGAGGVTMTFTNSATGTYTKSATGTKDTNVAFNNDGTVVVSGGILQFNGGGTNSATGTLTAGTGTTIRFTNSYSIADAAKLIAPGTGVFELTGGTLALPGTLSVPTFNQSGGTLSGTQTLGSGTTYNWTGGNWNSSGTTTVASGATLNLSTASSHNFDSRAIVNHGTLNWTGGNFVAGNGATLTNHAAFNDTSTGVFGNSGAGGTTMTFTNSATGTYTKGGTATKDTNALFHNDGALIVNGGILQLSSGGTNSANATMTAATGGTLRFSNNYTVVDASKLTTSGTGLIAISGGTLSLSGTLGAGTFGQTGGTLAGTHTLGTGATFTWSGGNWNTGALGPTSTIASGATLHLTTTNAHDFNFRTITNEGIVNWQGGQFRSGNGGGFVNAAGATFNDSADSFFNAAYGGTASFNNSGTFNKTGAGTTTFQSVFNNSGTANINAGTLALDGGGTAAAGSVFNIATGALLRFGSGTYTFASASNLSFAGTGTTAISGGIVTLSAGGFSPPTFVMSGGTLNVVDAAASSSIPTLSLSGGTMTLAGTLATTALTQSGGSIGAATFAVNGNSTWTAGDWSTAAASTATLASGTTHTLSGTNVKDFNRRVITNHGTVDWTGGQLRSGNGGGIINAIGATFNDSAGNAFNAAYGGSASFSNLGTFNKSGTGTSSFQSPFNNDGTVNLNAGTLSLTAGGSAAATGTFVVSAGSTLSFGGGTYTLASGASLSGGGTIALTGGALAVASGTASLASLNLTGGTLNGDGTAVIPSFTQTGGSVAIANLSLTGNITWNAGNWNSTAPSVASIAAGKTLTITDAATNVRDYNYRTITNHGTLNWHSAYLRSGNGGGIVNAADGTFNDLNASSYTVHSAYGGSSSFTNHGSYIRNATGTTSFDVPFHNHGALSVQQGDLQFRAGGTLGANGTIVAAANTNVTFTNGFTVTDGSSLSGAGTFRLTGGTLNVTGTLNTTALTQSGGTLSGLNAIVGTFNWNGGDWNAGAAGSSTTVSSNGTLNLTDANNNVRDFNRRAIVNEGVVNWHSGYIRSGTDGSFTNAAGGTFNDFNAPGYTITNPYGGAFVFTNLGTYNRNAAGTSYFDVPFDNQGTINLQQGDLQFRGGGTLTTSGRINTVTGTNVYFTNNYSIANGASLVGAGTYWLTGGTLTATGTMNVGTFRQTGGALAGTHTLNGIFHWTGGNWNASTPAAGDPLARTTIGTGATLNLTHDHNNVRDFNLRDIVNQGTVNWHSGYIRGGNGSTFTNAAGANFNDFNAPGYTITNPFGGSFTFLNQGNYTRDATGTSYFDTPFDNQGAIILTQGDLQFRGGGTLATGGTINAASGTNVYFTNNYNVANASSLLGAGTYWLTAGILTASGTINVSTFNQTGGSLSGTNTINGAFTWSGGNWNASTPPAGSPLARTTIATGATLNLTHDHNNVRDFNLREIVNQGTVNWHSGYLRGGTGSTFTNAAGATFNDFNASGYSVHNPFGGSFEFINLGTYTRNTTGTTYFDAPFNNSGTLNLVGGDIQIRQGGTMSASSVVNGSTDTHLYFTNNYTLADGARFFGPGLFNQTAGTLTIDGQLQASSFTWSGGNWNATANSGLTTTIASTTTLVLTHDHNNVRDFYGRGIVNQGVVNWHSGYLRAGQGSTFTNAAGGNFNDLNSSSYTIHNPFGGSFVFVNHGNYTRNTSGTTYFDTTFNNHAALNLLAGDIQIRSGGTMSASSVAHAAAGTHLYFTNSYTLADGARFTGPGLFQQTGGTLTLDGALTASNFTWSGGNWNAAANSGLTSFIAAGTTLTLTHDHDNVRDFYGRGIQNQGTINWQSGYLRSGQGGTFVNAAGGVFNDQNTSGYTVHNPFGGTFTFTNNGTYSKATTGTTTFSVPFTNNGTLAVTAGAVVFNSTFTNHGALALGGGATIQSSGAISLGTSALTGTGTLNAASVTAGGLVSPGHSAGTLTLTGNLTLLATSTLLFELGGGTAGSGYDRLSVGGNATLAGQLSLQFLNGYQLSVPSGATFTVLTAGGAGGLTGSFTNIANGQHLLTSDGAGYFQVNYGTGSAFAANSIVLSNFVAVPEPSTYVMLSLGAAVVLWQVRRRPARRR